MSPNIVEQVTALHALYIRATGMEIRLDAQRQRQWMDWCACGFSRDDLVLVIGWLRKGIANRSRNAGALKFSNLIGMWDHFEEDLAQARASLRPRVKTVETPVTRQVADGETVTVYDTVSEERPAHVQEYAHQAVDELRKKIRGGAGV